MSRLEQQRFTIPEVAADWQFGMSNTYRRGALCGHPLPAMANNWIHGAAHRHTAVPIRALFYKQEIL